MTAPKQTRSRGKWVALILVAMGIVAALAEWKFRPPTPQGMPATAPAEQDL